jgi:hypothetical protein
MMTKLKAFLVLLALVLLPAVASAQPNGYFFPPHWMYDPTLEALVAPNRILLPDGTAAAPGWGWTTEADGTGTGMYRRAASTVTTSINGVGVAEVSDGGLFVNGGYRLGFKAGALTTSTDVILTRGAANTLYQKNGANAQSFWLANTDDGAGNYERAELKWSGNTLTFANTFAGTGTLRPLQISAQYVSFVANILPSTGDIYSLGQTSGGWQTAYFSRSIQGSKSKSLTDAAAAASFVRIAVPTNGFAGGKVIYTATSTDGTNILVSQNECSFAAADTGGTVTAGAPTCGTPATAYKRANTLVCTITGAVSTTNYDLQAACTDNLAGTQTVTLNYRLDMPQPNTVTPQ